MPRKIAKELMGSHTLLVQGKHSLGPELEGRYHQLVTRDYTDAYNIGDPTLSTEEALSVATTETRSDMGRVLAGVRGSRTHLPRSSRGITDLKSARATGPHPLPGPK